MKTALYEEHLAAGGRIVPFAGWQLPLQYRSQLAEHHAVRQNAGMFDVSHMLGIDLEGEGAAPLLSRLLANDVGRLQQVGKALYSCMLNPEGGVLDDLLLYRLAEQRYRLVVNAATAERDLHWIEQQRVGYPVTLTPRRDLAMIAVQGPHARSKGAKVLPPKLAEGLLQLAPFHAQEAGEWLLARTGYTGEDGFEVMLPAAAAVPLWRSLQAVGVVACGLGARDTLRLEAGLNLNGHDMDEKTSPLESGLGWTVAWEPAERDFIGRSALEQQRQRGLHRQRVGLLLEGRGVLRNSLPLWKDGQQIGVITSGGYSPTLNCAIALARVAPESGDSCSVELRGQQRLLRIVRLPFVPFNRDSAPIRQ